MSGHDGPVGGPRAGPMPMLGLGTWQNTDSGECARAVETALERGYRHVDTAQAYGNEADVGRGIERADVDREDVFLATKVWTNQLAHDDVIASTERSLGKLGVDHVDLLYVHWPAGAYDPAETLPAFAELRDRGKVAHIGVSNFEPAHLDRAREAIDAPIFANQVELHPLLQQERLREYAADRDVELVAYSPLARGEVVADETLTAIAEKHGVSAAQVSLAWLRQAGVTAIPKATTAEHIADNWASLELELDEEDVRRIEAIERTDRRIHPSFAPDSWG